MPSQHSSFTVILSVFFILKRLFSNGKYENNLGPLSTAQRWFENLFVLSAPFVLVSRVFLNYHTVLQIITGSSIGLIIACVFFWTVGKKLDENIPTGTFFDKIVRQAESKKGITEVIADVTGVNKLNQKDATTGENLHQTPIMSYASKKPEEQAKIPEIKNSMNPRNIPEGIKVGTL